MTRKANAFFSHLRGGLHAIALPVLIDWVLRASLNPQIRRWTFLPQRPHVIPEPADVAAPCPRIGSARKNTHT